MARPEFQRVAAKEPFKGMSGKFEDFWAFAIPNLQMNNVRGWFAEYLVARALGIEAPIRIEWDPFDIKWEDIKIEVKRSAYLQAWSQAKLSTLRFGGLRARAGDPETDVMADEKAYNADVYVFCVNTALTHEEYNPLDLSQWSFAVLPKSTLLKIGQESISWIRVLELAGRELKWSDLRAAVKEAAR